MANVVETPTFWSLANPDTVHKAQSRPEPKPTRPQQRGVYIGICKKCGYLVYDGDLKFYPDQTVEVLGGDLNNFKDKLQSHLEHSHHAPETHLEVSLNDYRFIPKQPLTDFAVFNITRLTKEAEMAGFLMNLKRDALTKGRGKWTVRNTQVPKELKNLIPV